MLKNLFGYFRYGAKPKKTPKLTWEAEDEKLLSVIIPALPGIEGKLTARDVVSIIASADSGDPREQAALFLTMQEKEPIISAHLSTRRLAVLGCPYTIQSKTNKKQAEEIQSMLQKAKLRKAISHLLDAVGTGYSGVIVDWEVGGGYINGFKEIASSSWIFDEAGNPALSGVMQMPTPLTEYHPAQIIYVTHEGKAGLPCRKGLMRTLLWMYLFKNGGFREWTTFLERFGIPFIVGKIPPSDFNDVPARNKLKRALLEVRGGGVGIGTTETEVEFLNAVATGNTDAFEAFQRYCDEIITLTILGQLASSDSASGLSKGSAQEKVRQDILEADVLMIQDVLQKLIEYYCQMAYGWQDAKDIEIIFEYQPPENLESKANMFLTLSQAAGRVVNQNQIYDVFGVKLEGEIARQEEPKQIEFSDKSANNTIVENAIKKMINDDAFAAWQIPINRAIKEAFGDLDPEDLELVEKFKLQANKFLELLPGLMDEFDTRDFEQALIDTILASSLSGFLTAKK